MRNHIIMTVGAFFAVFLVFVSCVSVNPKRDPEPPVIVVRNSTTRLIKSVVLSEYRAKPVAGESIRYGEIAPVPPGVSQTLIRPDVTRVFPRSITVVWTWADGCRQSETLDLSKLLKTSRGLSNEVLVFEIIRSNRAIAFIEYTQI